MCLIALAHRASEDYLFVLAANRDEDYDRPSREAHFWDDAPDVYGGRDAVHGGSWLAITRGGRFAAVTNLRGAVQRTRSRGLLVSAFVTSAVTPEEFADEVAHNAHEYAGFHLLVGEIGKSIVYVSGERAMAQPLQNGIYGFSNAGDGEHWPKVDLAIEAMRLPHSALMSFLSSSGNTGRIEEEVFIRGERYGTRSSTVIVATMNEVQFHEQNYARGGAITGSRLARFLYS